MLNPKHKRYADRIRELIEEGQVIAKLEHPSSSGGASIHGKDTIPLQAWLINVSNILETVFGPQSPHVRHFEELTKYGIARVLYLSLIHI